MSLQQLISIHAPAKGATTVTQGSARPSVISIHAPAKGATVRKRTVYREMTEVHLSEFTLNVVISLLFYHIFARDSQHFMSN